MTAEVGVTIDKTSSGDIGKYIERLMDAGWSESGGKLERIESVLNGSYNGYVIFEKDSGIILFELDSYGNYYFSFPRNR